MKSSLLIPPIGDNFNPNPSMKKASYNIAPRGSNIYRAGSRTGYAIRGLSYAAAAAMRFRNGRSRTVTRNKKQSRSGQGVTTQHDARLIYRKRNMPRFRKRRWKRFRNKVLAVSEKDLGTQQVVFNRVLPTATNTDPTKQYVNDFGLYTLSSNNSWFNDLKQIASYLSNAATTPGTGLAVDVSSKVLFQSGILDVTIRNSSTNNGSPDSAARMEVDVYELTMRHTAEEASAVYQSLQAIFSTNFSQLKNIGGGAVGKIDYQLRGTTPFDLSYALSRFGIKIYKKTKYQLSNGDQITYQMRDPTRHSMVMREMLNQDGFNLPKVTRLVYIVGKLAPGLTVGAVGTPNVYQEGLSIGCTRKYTFKVENYSEDRTAYDAL